jgi:urease accessory protein
MTTAITSQSLVPKGQFSKSGTVSLGYEDRILRRKRLISDDNVAFLVNLPEVTNLLGGEGFLLSDGRVIEVVPAPEEVLVIRGDMPKLAWHIGNRHTPCQIDADRMMIRPDHVLQAMLAQLGADVQTEIAPFTPEGGAYGVGRTMGHSHGPEELTPELTSASGFGHHHGDGHIHFHPHPHSHSHD